MILQHLEDGRRALVTPMAEHLQTAAQLLAALDEGQVELPEPREIFSHIVGDHDAGWRAENERLDVSPDSGWPFHVFDIPDEAAERVYIASVESNARRHRYAGLLTGLHVLGLYNGRFGEGTASPLRGPGEIRMIERVQQICDALVPTLTSSPETAPWVEGRALDRAYRLLQLFDRVALFLNCGPPREGETPKRLRIPRVPAQGGDELGVEVRWMAPDRVLVTPFIFAPMPFAVTFEGRMLDRARRSRDALREALSRAERVVSRVTLAGGGTS